MDRTDVTPRPGNGNGQPEAGRSEEIRKDIQHTRASIDEKLDLLQARAKDLQHRARNALDVRHQVSNQVYQHPWAALGASVAAGYLLGVMTRSDEDDEWKYNFRPRRRSMSQRLHEVGERLHDVTERLSGVGHSVGERFSGVGQTMGDRISGVRESFQRNPERADLFETLKVAAGAALTDLAREAIRKYVPAVGEQLDQVWRERGLTPTAAASALFTPSRRESAPEPEAPSRTETSRSAYGTADMRRDFDPTVEPEHEATVRGEVSARS